MVNVWNVLDGRIRRLEKQQQQQAATVQNWDQSQYLMSATCPPTTTITIRGGQLCDTGWGDYYTTPSTSFDMMDYDTANKNGRFSNANWYIFYWLSIHPEGTRLYVGGPNGWWVEYATAAAAEEAAMDPECDQLRNFPPWDYGVSIGCLVLRNNGNTEEYNQFMPIDPVNRGRSYILRTHRNIAPRNVI